MGFHLSGMEVVRQWPRLLSPALLQCEVSTCLWCVIFADSKTVLAILGLFIVEAVYLFNSTCTFLLKALKSLVKDHRIACIKNWS